MNIGARHLVDDPHDRRRTIDLHFELRGPIVRQMADVFAEDWHFAAREQISVHEALPLDAGSTSCRVITDGPNEDFEELSFVMIAAIAAARREVDRKSTRLNSNHQYATRMPSSD